MEGIEKSKDARTSPCTIRENRGVIQKGFRDAVAPSQVFLFSCHPQNESVINIIKRDQRHELGGIGPAQSPSSFLAEISGGFLVFGGCGKIWVADPPLPPINDNYLWPFGERVL